jgi:hypothetical protein
MRIKARIRTDLLRERAWLSAIHFQSIYLYYNPMFSRMYIIIFGFIKIAQNSANMAIKI